VTHVSGAGTGADVFQKCESSIIIQFAILVVYVFKCGAKSDKLLAVDPVGGF
jgi:hypothetical protein